MLQKYLTYGNTFAAVEHAEKGLFNLLQLTQKKKELVIDKQKATTTIEDLIGFLKGQKHIFLVLNNEQVLFKKIANTNLEEKNLIRNAFPNISLAEFYYQIYQNNSDAFICIARKTTIDTIISQYEKNGISVIDFSLGNLALQNLQTFVGNRMLCSSNAQVEFQENNIQDIQKENVVNENYTINDLEVSNTVILSLAGIISYYTSNKSSSIYKTLKEQYIQKRFFTVGLKLGLGFLLVILLANFFFFSHYRNEVNDLVGELQLRETYKSQLSKLQEQVAQKKSLVESVQSASNSKLSKYFDKLGISTPETILLSQIHFQPIEGIQKKDKPLVFKQNKIIVTGISKEDKRFSDWIAGLEKTNWIEKITIHAYGKGKKTGSTATFEFLITTHD